MNTRRHSLQESCTRVLVRYTLSGSRSSRFLQIRRLLDEGDLSQRKIAARLGVSRGTISAIASGKRGIYGREPDARNPELCSLDMPPERCRGCGGMVYKPCVLCRARRYARRRQKLDQLTVARPPLHRHVA